MVILSMFVKQTDPKSHIDIIDQQEGQLRSSGDTQCAQNTHTISEDTQCTQITYMISEDTQCAQNTYTMSEDIQWAWNTYMISEDTMCTEYLYDK